MTVQELIELLEGCDPDAEVRFARQPAWPFESKVDLVVEVDVDQEAGVVPDRAVVYLTEGRQIGYLPGYVKEVLGW